MKRLPNLQLLKMLLCLGAEDIHLVSAETRFVTERQSVTGSSLTLSLTWSLCRSGSKASCFERIVDDGRTRTTASTPVTSTIGRAAVCGDVDFSDVVSRRRPTLIATRVYCTTEIKHGDIRLNYLATKVCELSPFGRSLTRKWCTQCVVRS